MSGDPEQDYFADGMVEDIITALSRIQVAVRHRAQFELHLQGPRRRRPAGRPRAGRALRAGRQRAQGRQPRAHHRPADRRDDRRHLWADRFDGARRHLRPAGSGHRERRRRDRAEARAGGDRACQRKPTEASTPTTFICAAWPTARGTREAIDERWRASLRRSSSIRVSPRPRDGGVLHSGARSTAGWPIVRGDRRGARLARRAIELGRDDAVSLTRGGDALANLTGDVPGGIALIDRALALNSNLASAWFLGGFLGI